MSNIRGHGKSVTNKMWILNAVTAGAITESMLRKKGRKVLIPEYSHPYSTVARKVKEIPKYMS